ncbi:bis(5'-nucleosyl)-tetraphosphatase (symmetrical) YqeK [uncultured Limosilactobacillus sp.]|uniref:bis(5'-nucleosyl)-tetraphosphatase (symmetrical) YqeK n=1 Tax=uncultured Limosilactobacillus sp. TaxID=2837629 RepID=UPI0025E48538|nr:bis(5'-nucleosyl)-tetraphosphatase (symmetrical) YqeK [uncultured Limosilactobacillus sp.]
MTKQQTIYHEHLLPLTRVELISRLKSALSPSRFEHVCRVEQMAIQLAQLNNVDVEKASVAGLCHDYAKQRPDKDFIQIIHEHQMAPELLQYGNAIWHGVVGAEMVKGELGVHDEDILNAIRQHTTGARYMTKLAQIIYMADYIEPGRDFPGVQEARQITKTNLAAGVAYQTKHTLEYLVEKGKPVYPKTIDTYNAWVPKYRKEIN